MKCGFDGCDKETKALGLCGTHYMRQRRTGSAHTVRPPGIAGQMRSHRMYGGWGGMVNRCHNPKNSSYARYGALGVFVCERWKAGDGQSTGFQCFLSDMGERPEGMTLDRIESLGSYCKDNCQWATPKEQRQNLSSRGRVNMSIKGSTAKRTREYCSLGNAIYARGKATNRSMNVLSSQLGFGASYTFAVCTGLKSPSARFIAALEADGFQTALGSMDQRADSKTASPF